MQALYPNIAEDGDELSFSEGDIMTVTGQVNSEWLICSFGQRTGIVPANFVQEVKIWQGCQSKLTGQVITNSQTIIQKYYFITFLL